MDLKNICICCEYENQKALATWWPIGYGYMCPREKKGLKIPNGSSESVNPRRTDNTMAKRKSTKGQTTTYKHTHKTKDRVTRTPAISL